MNRKEKKETIKSVVEGKTNFDDLTDAAKEEMLKYIKGRMRMIRLHFFFKLIKDVIIIIAVIIIVLLLIRTYLTLTGQM